MNSISYERERQLKLFLSQNGRDRIDNNEYIYLETNTRDMYLSRVNYFVRSHDERTHATVKR